MAKIGTDSVKALFSTSSKEINEFLKNHRDELITYLDGYRTSPELYDENSLDELLIKLEKIQVSKIYIPRVHKYKLLENLKESEAVRIMTKSDFINYSISFFGPNYELNKDSNLLNSISEELFNEIVLFGNE